MESSAQGGRAASLSPRVRCPGPDDVLAEPVERAWAWPLKPLTDAAQLYILYGKSLMK
jgi:hypothetical protein